MCPNFVEVTLKTDLDSGDLLAMLHEGESLGCWEDEGILHIYWAEEKWSVAILEDLKQTLTSLGVKESGACLAVNSVPDQDWNTTWAASLHPIRLGRHVRIRQSWHSGDAAFDGIELIIDPKRAFGTGHHITTQLLVEWLEDRIRGGERILDIGTGSGILSMVALRLGAASALAIDIDPVALECAQEYVEINGFGNELELRIASFEDLNLDRFDVIVANLDGKTLPLLCQYLPRLLRTEGNACLSGLQQQDYGEVVESLRREGIQVISCMKREDWLAVEVKIADLKSSSL